MVFMIFVEAHGCVFRLVHVNAHVSEILVESKLIAVRSPQLSSLYMYMCMYMRMYPHMYVVSILFQNSLKLDLFFKLIRISFNCMYNDIRSEFRWMCDYVYTKKISYLRCFIKNFTYNQ